jgi:NAD(P)-dependent dehydrogenase (short-subunit alcohol dehydrogenase family)
MRVVITGGTRGFGLALARRLDAMGHRVVVTSRSPPSGAGGPRAERCDSSDYDEVLELAESAAGRMGGIDAWVNSAGAGMGTADDLGLSDDRWAEGVREVVGANVMGVFHGTHCAMRVRTRHVFNVYGAGFDGRARHAAGHGVYASTKACVSFYTRVLARQGVKVHGVIPGIMRTEMLERSCAGLSDGRRRALLAMSVDPEAVAERAAAEIVRTVERDEGPREIDCYSPSLFRKALSVVGERIGRACNACREARSGRG